MSRLKFGPAPPPNFAPSAREREMMQDTATELTEPYVSREAGKLLGHSGAVLCVRFTPDGEYSVSGGRDRSIRLWNPKTQLLIKKYPAEHGYEVWDCVVSTDNTRMVSGGGDRIAMLWDVAQGVVIRRYRGHDGKVNSVCLNSASTVFASASFDHTVRVWDVRSQNRDPLQILSSFKDSVSCVKMDDHCIIAAGVDGVIKQFDIRMGLETTDYVCQAVTSVSLSHDSACLLVSCMDDRVRLFDRASGHLLNEFSSHMHHQFQTQSCFTPDDAYVVSGSEDGFVYVWNIVDGGVVSKLNGHESRAVNSVSHHPTQISLLSAATDGSISVWK